MTFVVKTKDSANEIFTKQANKAVIIRCLHFGVDAIMLNSGYNMNILKISSKIGNGKQMNKQTDYSLKEIKTLSKSNINEYFFNHVKTFGYIRS